jgi:hypothetical protein
MRNIDFLVVLKCSKTELCVVCVSREMDTYKYAGSMSPNKCMLYWLSAPAPVDR